MHHARPPYSWDRTTPRDYTARSFRPVQPVAKPPREIKADRLSGERYIPTQREVTILNELVTGAGNKEIAARSSICEGTVKVYFSRLFVRTGFSTRLELALWWLARSRSTRSQVPADSFAALTGCEGAD